MPTLHRTTCNRDCPDACGLVATVDGGRVTRLQGDPDHPVTRGFLCYRTGEFLATQYAPDRVTTPLVRRDGQLVPATWDEALDLIAARLLAIRAESGPEAIFHYRSGGTLGVLPAVVDHLFDQLGPCTGKRGDICSGAGDAAQLADFGEEDSHDVFDLLNAKNIVLWGKNPVVSGPHLVPILRDAKKRGAHLTLIDPVHHRSAGFCDTFHQPRPGGDFALAMAVARVLFDRGHVDPDAARYCDHLDAFRALAESRSVEDWCADADVPVTCAADLAERLGPGKPTAILVGWGMGRRVNGGGIVRALDALAAISGNLGIPGGGVSFYFKRRRAFRSPFPAVTHPRTICEITMGPDLLRADPPVRAMWVTAGNPVVMLPDSASVAKALGAMEFLVVCDHLLTDTAKLAHVVLPTTTLLESDDLVGAYGHHWLGASTPAVPPLGEARSDFEIAQALAPRLGLGDLLAGTAKEWKARFLRPELGEHGITVDTLEAGAVRNPLAATILYADRTFPTATGRVNLLTAAPPSPRAPAGYPLWLLSLSTEKSQSSQWAHPPEGLAVATVHPDASAGIPDGGTAWLRSEIGAIQVRVVHDDRQRRDVVIVPKGGHLGAGRAANLLVRAQVTDIGEGGALYDERVRLEPA